MVQFVGEAGSSKKVRGVIWSSFLGTTLEWYDFFIYGTVAALVFNKLFFPSFDPAVGVLLSFGTFTAGFIARPLGALIFGHYGDTLGRKRILVLTMLLMGLATVGIGLLPTYDQVGVVATCLLVILRLAQGLALGGEWGGAVLMVAEHGDSQRRGLQTSWAQIGVPAGNLLSVGAIAAMSAMLPEKEFLSWGWRVPFLLSGILIAVALWVRSGIDESPKFMALAGEKRTSSRPLIDLIKGHPRSLFVACFIRIGTDVAFYIFSLFVLTYVTGTLGLSRSVALQGVLVASAIQMFTIPWFASLSDRFGRQPIFLVGSIGAIVWIFLFFPLLGTKDPLLITTAICVAMTFWALMYGPLAALISELFPTHVRYSGISLGYQLAGIFGGGLAPLIAAALLKEYQSPTAVAIYVAAALALTTVAAFLSRNYDHAG
ncbi:MFS transporter [Bradyrhizobium sp. HKCCYLS2038]|uniref:MFS transporter n=1 Tax=unclassified Bradyrhizobium TaxID=2631580 RepID=UPI003EBE2915